MGNQTPLPSRQWDRGYCRPVFFLQTQAQQITIKLCHFYNFDSSTVRQSNAAVSTKHHVTFSSNRLEKSELLQDLDEKSHDHQDGDHLEAIQVHHSEEHSLHCKPRSQNLPGLSTVRQKSPPKKYQEKNNGQVGMSQPHTLEQQERGSSRKWRERTTCLPPFRGIRDLKALFL